MALVKREGLDEVYLFELGDFKKGTNPVTSCGLQKRLSACYLVRIFSLTAALSAK
jgi:hypothetical protein